MVLFFHSFLIFPPKKIPPLAICTSSIVKNKGSKWPHKHIQKQSKSSLQSTKNNKKKRKQKRRQKKADDAHNKEWQPTEKGEKE